MFLVLVWPLCMWVAYRAAGYDVQPWETFLDRQPFLDSGPLWFVQVLLYVSIGYALWPSVGADAIRADPDSAWSGHGRSRWRSF